MVTSNQTSPLASNILPDNRPTDYEYALLSEHVYQGAALNKNDTVPKTEDWKVNKVIFGESDYVGAIYINNRTRQVVLVHRGTYSLGSLLEDFKGVYLKKISPQKIAVFKAIDKAIDLAKGWNCHLSFTGHSLGAFLAELSVYYCHRSKNYPDVNAVTFESPGSRESLEELQPNLAQGKIDLEQLDIINYLSYPNLVNTCGHHVGTCYGLDPNLGNHGWVYIWHLKQAHAMSNIVKLFENSEYSARYIIDWPMGNQRQYFFSNAVFKSGTYSLKDGTNDFDLDYRAHYSLHKDYTNRNTLLLIHFSQPMQAWLKAFYKSLEHYQRINNLDKQALAQALADYAKDNLQNDATILEYLVGNRIAKQHNGAKVFQVATDNISVFDIRKVLSTWLKENPDKAGKLLGFLHATTYQEPDSIEARLIEEGGDFTHQGHIGTANVHATLDEFPEDTNQINIEYLKDLRQHFLKSVADSGVKIRAFGISKASKFAGNIGNLNVIGSAVRAVPRNQNVDSSSAQLINQQRTKDGLAQQPPVAARKDEVDHLQLAEKKSTTMSHQL
ncbi:MAG: hypothetical protein K0S11_1293 [Gammaproteobacteria bacterium]|jgi:hypothetical protein|nr:hypothetical protein [Gammaproteobacteria bacterium]